MLHIFLIIRQAGRVASDHGWAMKNIPVQLIGGTNLLNLRELTQKPANRPAEQFMPDDLEQ